MHIHLKQSLCGWDAFIVKVENQMIYFIDQLLRASCKPLVLHKFLFICMKERCIFLKRNKEKQSSKARYKRPEASIDIQTKRGTQLSSTQHAGISASVSSLRTVRHCYSYICYLLSQNELKLHPRNARLSLRRSLTNSPSPFQNSLAA